MTAPTVPANLLPARTGPELLALARRGLDDATAADGRHHWGLAYAQAYLAALRGGAALVAARAVAGPRRPGALLPGVWDLVATVTAGEPGLAAQAAWFAANTAGPHPPAAADTGRMLGMVAGWLDDITEAVVYGPPHREG